MNHHEILQVYPLTFDSWTCSLKLIVIVEPWNRRFSAVWNRQPRCWCSVNCKSLLVWMPSGRGDMAGINMGYSQCETPHSDQVQFYINLHLSILLDSLLSCLSLSIFFGVGIAKNQQFLVKMAVARTWHGQHGNTQAIDGSSWRFIHRWCRIIWFDP